MIQSDGSGLKKSICVSTLITRAMTQKTFIALENVKYSIFHSAFELSHHSLSIVMLHKL